MGTNLALQIIELQTELKEKPLMGIMREKLTINEAVDKS